jgi:hypothetical protein
MYHPGGTIKRIPRKQETDTIPLIVLYEETTSSFQYYRNVFYQTTDKPEVDWEFWYTSIFRYTKYFTTFVHSLGKNLIGKQIC